MAILIIPVRFDIPAYDMVVELDERFYTLAFRFNARNQHWFMDVDFDGSRVLNAVKLVESDDLLALFAYLQADGRLPPGTFQVTDTLSLGRNPGVDTLGGEVIMTYTEQ